MPPAQREIVHAFARRLDEIPPDLLAALKRIVLKSACGDIAFERRRRGVLVPPLSFERIRVFADKVRSAFVEEGEVEFPIMDVLEFRMEVLFPGFYVDVREVEEMGDDEGRVVAGESAIALRLDVYRGAWFGNRRDRFTASHELGHFLIHRHVTMMRARDDNNRIYCDSEWQADRFAGCLLMSVKHLPMFDDPNDAAEQCSIRSAAARTMWNVYQAAGLMAKRPTPGVWPQSRFV
jgi:hypothetical protein